MIVTGAAIHPATKNIGLGSRETPLLRIAPGDVISDNGYEIYSVLREHQINTVLMMGVHADMCILNRSFGIRQLTKWGMHCILVRDLTDAMYNPASAPHVSHSAGTELVGCRRVTVTRADTPYSGAYRDNDPIE